MQANAFPSDVNLWQAMGDMGLHGITVAEEDGGLGLGYLHHCIAMEVRPCCGFAVIMFTAVHLVSSCQP